MLQSVKSKWFEENIMDSNISHQVGLLVKDGETGDSIAEKLRDDFACTIQEAVEILGLACFHVGVEGKR